MKTSDFFVFPVLALCTSTTWSAQQLDKTVALSPGGTVEISVVSGSLQIRGGTRNEAHISGTIGDESKLEIGGEGARVSIKVVPPRNSSEKNQSTQLIVELPAKAKLVTSTVSAYTRIQGMQGTQQLQTVSGDIETELLGEDLSIQTVSGSVQARGNDSPAHITLNSVSGDMTLSNIGGYVDATTVSADLTLRLGALSAAKLRTTSGDIELGGSLRSDARVDIESTSGGVDFKISGQRDAEYKLSSLSGEVSSCFGPQQASKRKYGPGADLRFSEGKGSARVNVNTLSGDIMLCN